MLQFIISGDTVILFIDHVFWIMTTFVASSILNNRLKIKPKRPIPPVQVAEPTHNHVETQFELESDFFLRIKKYFWIEI